MPTKVRSSWILKILRAFVGVGCVRSTGSLDDAPFLFRDAWGLLITLRWDGVIGGLFKIGNADSDRVPTESLLFVDFLLIVSGVAHAS